MQKNVVIVSKKTKITYALSLFDLFGNFSLS